MRSRGSSRPICHRRPLAKHKHCSPSRSIGVDLTRILRGRRHDQQSGQIPEANKVKLGKVRRKLAPGNPLIQTRKSAASELSGRSPPITAWRNTVQRIFKSVRPTGWVRRVGAMGSRRWLLNRRPTSSRSNAAPAEISTTNALTLLWRCRPPKRQYRLGN